MSFILKNLHNKNFIAKTKNLKIKVQDLIDSFNKSNKHK